MNSQAIPTRTDAKQFRKISSPKTKKSRSQCANEPVQKNNDSPNSERNNNPATSPEPDESLYASSSALQETFFRIEAPSAAEVLLVGDFTEWDKAPIKLLKGGGGSWHTKVALPRGRHFYRFLVDGKWQDDPHRPGREPNHFGTTNSFAVVT